MRTALSVIEYGELLERRKKIYESLHPKTKVGQAQAAGMNRAIGKNVGDKMSVTLKSFAQDTADKLGVSSRKQKLKFLESIADLKDLTKGYKQSPEDFILEYAAYIKTFQQGMEPFCLSNYEEAFPALSQEQLRTLMHLTDFRCKTLEGYLGFVKETCANG